MELNSVTFSDIDKEETQGSGIYFSEGTEYKV